MCLMLVSSLAYAAVGVQEDGTRKGTATDINFTGDVTVTGSGSVIGVAIDNTDDWTNEVVTATNDTVTAADTFTRYIATATSATTTFTLPTAAANLEYIFCNGDTAAQTITVAPASTADTIEYLALDAGDTIDSSATGDSVHLIGASGTWYVVDTGSNAWTDGGAS